MLTCLKVLFTSATESIITQSSRIAGALVHNSVHTSHFWLGYVRTVTVGTTSSMHLLMKPMTEVVYSSMTLDESRNILQSVLAKQSCSVASTSSDHFRIEGVTGTSYFSFCL